MTEPKSIVRAKQAIGQVWVDGELYWTPAPVLNELDRLKAQIERMKSDTIIMSAIINSGMSEDEKAALTYETGPYDITVLTCGIRKFVNTLIEKSGEQNEI